MYLGAADSPESGVAARAGHLDPNVCTSANRMFCVDVSALVPGQPADSVAPSRRAHGLHGGWLSAALCSNQQFRGIGVGATIVAAALAAAQRAQSIFDHPDCLHVSRWPLDPTLGILAIAVLRVLVG